MLWGPVPTSLFCSRDWLIVLVTASRWRLPVSHGALAQNGKPRERCIQRRAFHHDGGSSRSTDHGVTDVPGATSRLIIASALSDGGGSGGNQDPRFRANGRVTQLSCEMAELTEIAWKPFVVQRVLVQGFQVRLGLHGGLLICDLDNVTWPWSWGAQDCGHVRLAHRWLRPRCDY